MPANDILLRRIMWLIIGLALLFVAVWQASPLRALQGADVMPLPLHIFAETFSIVVAMLVFGVAWNAFSMERPGSIMILACAFLAVGLIDFAHMLSFNGMPDFVTPASREKGINFWLAARFIAALAMLIAALRPWQPLSDPHIRHWLLAASLAVTALVYWLGLSYQQAWPRTFIEGQGLTPFKVAAEYAVIAILLVPAVLCYIKAKQPQPYDAASLFAAAVISILSELSFTLYTEVTDIFNLLGHAYKIVAYAFIYRAVFVGSVREPFQRLETELAERKRKEEALRESEEKFRVIVSSANDAVVMIDAEGKVEFWSAAAERIFGYPAADAIGKPLHHLIVPERFRADAGRGFARFQESGEGPVIGKTLELTALRKDGSEFSAQHSISAVKMGGRWHAIGIIADNTEHKQAEQALRDSEQRFRSLFEAASDMIHLIDPQGVILQTNPATLHISGYAESEVVGHALREFFTPASQQVFDEQFPILLERGTNRQEVDFVTKDGTVYTIDCQASAVRDAQGAIRFIVVYQRDVTERKRAEEKLRLDAKVFENSAEGILITDTRENILTVNRAFTAITGFSPAEVIGKTPGMVFSGLPGTEEIMRAIGEALAVEGHWAGEVPQRRMNGEIFPCWLDVSVVKDREGKVTNVISMLSDISARREAEERILRLSQFDALTGLPNRLLLEDRLGQAIALAARYRKHAALLFINLDHFSSVNETLGFAVGDQVLIAVAKRLLDAVTRETTVARLSADNFMAVIGGVEQASSLSATANAILLAIAEPMAIAGHDIHLTASIGISLYPDDGEDGGVLMSNASTALNRAQEGARGGYQFYKPEMNARVMEVMALADGLHHALEREEMVLFYQPQLDLNSGEIIGMEALLRWLHPDRGQLAPDAFMAVAEEAGLIEPIGRWVLRQACRQAKAWQEAGFPFLHMAVNLSTFQSRRESVPETVAAALAESGLPARFLELEMTESFIVEKSGEAGDVLSQLKELGVRLVVDRFGSGYSSLNDLRLIALDKLKIDQSFIRDITRNKADAAIVQAIIVLGHSLKFDVIAVGVETEAQLHYLRSIFCDGVQGVYFSPPLAADAALKLLQSRARAVVAPAVGPPRTLLLVDDEENILLALKRHLRRDGYRILTAATALEALDLLAGSEVGVILTDQRMPETSGIELLSQVKVIHPDTVRMILSGYTDVEAVTAAINTGEVYKFLTKPWKEDELRSVIRDAFERYESAKQAKAKGSPPEA